MIEKIENLKKKLVGKVESGLDRMKLEQDQQVKRETELKDLKQELETLSSAKKFLG